MNPALTGISSIGAGVAPAELIDQRSACLRCLATFFSVSTTGPVSASAMGPVFARAVRAGSAKTLSKNR